MNDFFTPAEAFESKKAKIKVIGVGGGGGNAINHMVEAGLQDIDFIAVNTARWRTAYLRNKLIRRMLRPYWRRPRVFVLSFSDSRMRH